MTYGFDRSALISYLALALLPASLLASSRTEAAPKQSATPTSALTLKQVIQSVSPSVVRLTVRDQDGEPSVLGSGLVVGPDTIATNLHVVAGAHAVTANFPSGRSETVMGFVGMDSEHDLVLLRANTQGVRSLPLEEETQVEVGDPVVAIGSPEGFSGSVSTGIVSALRMRNGTKLIQTTAPISHGSSGGGLIDMNGRIIGVTSLSYSDGQNLNFAYPAYFLSQMMKHPAIKVLTWKQVEDAAQIEGAAQKEATPPKSEKTSPAETTPPTPAPHRDYSAIDSQEAGPVGDFAEVDLPSHIDGSTLTNTSVVISYVIDEDGHPTNIRVKKGSGNAEVDDACKEAIRRTRFRPAIKDHLKLKTPADFTFTLG